jgi:hypothetical protein
MAHNQPKKAGAYDRPLTGTARSMALTLGIIAVLAVSIVALLFLRYEPCRNACMERVGSKKVQDNDGAGGTVVPASLHLSSHTAQVVVQTESGQPVLVPKDRLVQQPDGHSYVPLSGRARAHSQRAWWAPGCAPGGAGACGRAGDTEAAGRDRHSAHDHSGPRTQGPCRCTAVA